MQRRSFMPLPQMDQAKFSAYNEIDLPSESRIESIRKAGLARSNDEWVALEQLETVARHYVRLLEAS